MVSYFSVNVLHLIGKESDTEGFDITGVTWSIYCDVIEFSFFVCYVEDNLLTWRPSTCRVYQIPET